MPKKKSVPAPKADVKAHTKGFPIATYDPDSYRRTTPAWLFSRLDLAQSWSDRDPLTLAQLREEILPKIKSYESMTWAEIERNAWRDHSIEVARLVPEARARLEEIGLADLDELFRFRLAGEQRLWGIRDRHYFKILWWDPKHRVCPSVKRGT